MKPIPSSAELLERFRATVDAGMRPSLAPGQSLPWGKAFSRWNLIRAGCVRLAERVLYIVDDRFRAGFLDTAEGEDLDRWQRSEAPGYPRKPASASTTRLTLSRGSSSTSGTIDAGSRFSTVATSRVPAVTFVSVADAPVTTGVTTVYVDVECEATDVEGNVDAGTITRALTPLFDTFTVTNTARAAGGGPAESDADFRDRLRQRDARNRRGTPEALTLGALMVPGVSRVLIADPMNDDDIAPGSAEVMVADASGIGSQRMADLVSVELLNWRAAGVRVQVYPATTASLLTAPELSIGISAVRFTVYFTNSTSFDRIAVEKRARDAIARMFAAQRANTALYVDQLRRAVLEADARIRSVAVMGLHPPGSWLDMVDLAAPTTRGQRWDGPDAIFRFEFAAVT